eukprot:1613085-Rhodomonas_salina.1
MTWERGSEKEAGGGIESSDGRKEEEIEKEAAAAAEEEGSITSFPRPTASTFTGSTWTGLLSTCVIRT